MNWPINLQDAGRILANSIGLGNAGNININTGSLLISSGSSIQNNAIGSGNAGDVRINAAGDVVIDGETNRFIGIATGSLTSAAGRAGNISINADSLLMNGGFLSSSAAGQSGSGDITINTRDRVLISNEGQITINLATIVNASANAQNSLSAR